MMKKNVRVIIATVAALFAVTTMFTGCNPKKAWKTDYEEAKKIATEKNKNIFILFSGDDWDKNSAEFKKNIMETKTFVNAMKKDYILVNIDYSKDVYQSANIDESKATDKEKKRAEEIDAEYKIKNQLAKDFEVNTYPSTYIVSPEGYIISNVEFDAKIVDPKEYLKKIDEKKETVDKITKLRAAVNAATGIDRVKAIDELYEAIGLEGRSSLQSLFREVLTLDKDNTTGLLGKYEMQIAYVDAIQKAQKMDSDGASQVFVDACNNGHFDAKQKQEAYYTAAYVLASSGSQDYDKMISLLNQAYDSNPTSEHAQEIKSTIEAVLATKQNAASQSVSPTAPKESEKSK